MAVMITANTAAFNKSLQQSQNQFSNFTTSIKRLAAGIGIGFGINEIFQGVRQSIGVMADFEATMSEVKAITGATGAEFQELEKDARRLGASTKFTATQVGQLQVAYGRLGFTTREILNATEATLDLAAATGEDLAKSADVAGSTVRGFALNAKETQRVVDVMASSFNKTALGLENFTESMKYVAPVANAAGATVEETTALLGVLADSGIRGSMAGTSLRKIFTDMTKDGRPLKERLAELGERGITLADSFDEVGRTAQTSLLILSKNTEKTDALTKSFQNVTGEAAKMARIMQDNLTGDVTKLSSAWEGLILSLSNSEPLRRVTQHITGLLNSLSGTADLSFELDNLAKAINEGFGDIDNGLDPFIKRLADVRREIGKPIDINQVQELGEKYKLTDDQVNKLYSSVLEANKALSFQEKAMQQFNEFVERNGYEDLSKAVDDYKSRLYQLILQEQIHREQLIKTGQQSKAFKNTEQIQSANEQIAAYRRVINILAEYQKNLTTTTETAITQGEKFVQSAFFTLSLDDPFFAKGQKSGTNFMKDLGMDAKYFNNELEKAGENVKNIAPPANVKEQWVDFTGVVTSGLSGIGYALGSAISGSQNLGDALLGVLGGVLVQLGEMLIAAGIGVEAFKESLKSLNGYVAIAAGVALVALGAAISGSIKNLGSKAGGGGSSRSGGFSDSANNWTTNGSMQDSAPKLVTVIKGQDLWVMLSNYQKGNIHTRAVG